MKEVSYIDCLFPRGFFIFIWLWRESDAWYESFKWLGWLISLKEMNMVHIPGKEHEHLASLKFCACTCVLCTPLSSSWKLQQILVNKNLKKEVTSCFYLMIPNVQEFQYSSGVQQSQYSLFLSNDGKFPRVRSESPSSTSIWVNLLHLGSFLGSAQLSLNLF